MTAPLSPESRARRTKAVDKVHSLLELHTPGYAPTGGMARTDAVILVGILLLIALGALAGIGAVTLFGAAGVLVALLPGVFMIGGVR